MKFTSALSALATLCQVAYSLEDGTYLIIPDSISGPPPFPIGANSEGPVNPLVVGGRNIQWKFKQQDRPDTFTIERDGSGLGEFVYCQSEGCFTSIFPGSGGEFRLQETPNDGVYAITIPSPLWPTRTWTLTNTSPGTQVKIGVFELEPSEHQRFRILPVLRD